jgi:hypothetical protein
MNIGRPPFEFVPHLIYLIYLIAFLFPWCCWTLRSQAMVLRRTYASLNILGGPPQHTQAALFPYPGPVDQSNPLSVSPTEVPVPPHSAHYDRSQLSQITALFRTPMASPISRQTSPLGPHQSSLPDRPIFPRSKSDPSLYRKAQIQRFRRSSRGREFFRRKKIFASVTDAITKPKNGGVPAVILTGSGIVAAGLDWEVVDGMA